MAALIWPVELPQWVRAGATYESGRNAIRTEVDQGPAKVRKRFTRGVGKVTLNLELTDAQAERLRVFYENDTSGTPYGTGGGTMPFEHVDPVLGTAHDYRFLEPPRLVLDAAAGYWRTTVVLESVY